MLALAGGRFDLGRVAAHCAAHRADDPVFCGMKDPDAAPIATDTARADARPLSDPRVRAGVALAPLGVVFDAGSLERIAVPVAIWGAANDRWLLPRFHAERLAAHIPGAVLHVVPNARHFAFVDRPSIPIPSEDDLCADPPGFDREAFLRELQGGVPAFFDAAFAAPAAPIRSAPTAPRQSAR